MHITLLLLQCDIAVFIDNFLDNANIYWNILIIKIVFKHIIYVSSAIETISFIEIRFYSVIKV